MGRITLRAARSDAWRRMDDVLFATEARRRMAALSVTALLFSVVTSGGDVIMPLWVTRDLHCSPAQWAQLRSLRMLGVLGGVVFLGALSDRFGQRLLGAISMVASAAMLVVLRMGPPHTIWVVMPIYGALISTTFVNLNTLTQDVSNHRQGLANTVYRSVGAAAGIGAPILCTTLQGAWGGYRPVFLLLAGCQVIGGGVLMLYPGEASPPPLSGLRNELRRLWGGYAAAFRERELMRLTHLSLTWTSCAGAVGAFAAIRFTRQLGQPDQQFGHLCALAGAAGFLTTAAAGFYLDRASLRRAHVVACAGSSACSILMGMTNSLPLTAVGFIGFALLASMIAAPNSMWTSRAAVHCSQTSAFSVQKLLAAVYGAASMALLSYLEVAIGIRKILFLSGVIGFAVAILYLRLAEPSRPGRRVGDAAGHVAVLPTECREPGSGGAAGTDEHCRDSAGNGGIRSDCTRRSAEGNL